MATDKEYIEKVIRNYERRKTIAVIFGVVTIVLAGASYFAYVELGKGHKYYWLLNHIVG